jgi:diadenylate cyclase
MTKLLDLLLDKIYRFNPLHPLDLLDFIIAFSLVMSFLYYTSRFPVFRVIIGTLILLCLTVIAFIAGFVFTGAVIGSVTFLVLVALPLIFAPEIRHYLEKLGRFNFLHKLFIRGNKNGYFIRHLVSAVYELAERGVGGTIVLQRRTGLGETIDTGVVIDAQFSSKILHNIFFPKSPLHDGAVVIRDGRIVAAGCLLPLSPDVKLDTPFGTRHRAGLSITKDTDAVVILVSEQRGEVSLAHNGKLDINLDRATLTEKLNRHLR